MIGQYSVDLVSVFSVYRKRRSNLLKPNLGAKWVKNGACKNIVLCSHHNTHRNRAVDKKTIITKISGKKIH